MNLLQQFLGPKGKADLRELLREQRLLIGAEPALQPMADAVEEVLEYAKGKQIYAEGESMKPVLYLVLGGRIDLDRRGVFVAPLGRGQFLGEFPLLDRTSRYAVSATTAEHSIVAELQWARFAVLADSNPRVWRNLATELALRLRGPTEPKAPAEAKGKPSSFGEFFWPWVEGLQARWKLVLGIPLVLIVGLYSLWSTLPEANKIFLLSTIGLHATSHSAPASAPPK